MDPVLVDQSAAAFQVRWLMVFTGTFDPAFVCVFSAKVLGTITLAKSFPPLMKIRGAAETDALVAAVTL
jgi:hypothetical protein